MPNPPFSPVDLQALRRKTLFDNYGLSDFDPSMVQDTPNPIQDPGFQVDLPDNPMGITPSDPRQDPFSKSFGGASVRPPAGHSPSPSFQDIMGSFDTSHQDAYDRLLAGRPERGSPDIAHRIVAAGMGLGAKDPISALKTQEGVMYGDSDRQLKDWADQVEPSYRAAQLENTANANERQMRSSYMTNQANMQRYQDMNDQATRRSDLQQQKQSDQNAIDVEKNKLAKLKYEHPDLKFNFDGPTVTYYDPRGGGIIETGVKTGNMTDLDKINLNQTNEIARIHARGDEAQQTKATPSGTPTGGSGNPVVQRNMRFQNVYDTATDEEKSFMIPPATTNGSWQFAKRPTKGILTGSKDYAAKVAAYDALVAKVNGGGAAPKAGPSANTAPPGATPSTKKAPPIGGSNTPPAPAPPKEPSYVPRGEYGGKVEPGGDNTPWIAKPFIPAAKAIGEHITKGAAGMGDSGLPPTQVMTPDGPRTIPPGEVAVADPTGKPMGTIPRAQLADAIKNGWKEIK